ncbi:uncharacterized protein LOC131597708 [Vicia villosa]|uniref:uncharacterized protein LOC131597708 n=1 Tax=Vicia villosa TaxID=3911 RepID=UPI00273AC86F|nr:uncharacterized protein LOC131597708 [Vicia villosa]
MRNMRKFIGSFESSKGVLNSIKDVKKEICKQFTPGRQLLDGVPVANKAIDLSTRTKKDCLFFKVYFKKAYDKVNANFLRFVMKKMGFRELWMEACVFTSFMSILRNGSPTKDFEVRRGLRQGDPLSHFFVLVTESLTGLVNKASVLGEFIGFKVNDRSSFYIL